jgi:hypothetical protein
MALVTEQRLITKASRVLRPLRKSAAMLLEEQAKVSEEVYFDIFLSHSIMDAQKVLGAKQDLEEAGFRVYVDWIGDPQLSRRDVRPSTAARLRLRMRHCRCLLYLHTINSEASIWMPWELGFFDGHDGKVAIFPVVKLEADSFKGREYLGIYPYIDVATTRDSEMEYFWVNRSVSVYATLSAWLKDSRAIRPH